MKKMIFVLLIIGLLFSCKQQQQVVQTPEQVSLQKLEAQKPTVWKQAIYPALVVGDPISFMPSSEIVLSGSFLDQVFMLQDGNIYRVDSVLEVLKTVPALTPGALVTMKKDNIGKILEMNISMDRNDASYLFNFQLKQDGSFALNANANLTYNGKNYPIQASQKGGECLLLVNFFVEKKVQSVSEQAGGVSVSGTKVVPVKK